MTTILIVDSQPHTRLKLQFELLHSGQFQRVLACDNLLKAEAELSKLSVQVMLLASSLAVGQQDLKHLATHHPELSLVMVHENSAQAPNQAPEAVHAHMQSTGSVMEWVACIAKALVVRAKGASMSNSLKTPTPG